MEAEVAVQLGVSRFERVAEYRLPIPALCVSDFFGSVAGCELTHNFREFVDGFDSSTSNKRMVDIRVDCCGKGVVGSQVLHSFSGDSVIDAHEFCGLVYAFLRGTIGKRALLGEKGVWHAAVVRCAQSKPQLVIMRLPPDSQSLRIGLLDSPLFFPMSPDALVFSRYLHR